MNEIFEGYNEFIKLRRDLLDTLKKIDMSYGCKSYEGTFEICFSYPNFFDECLGDNPTDAPDYVSIELFCYVLGPSRHYEWHGMTITETVKNARSDIERWIRDKMTES